VVLGIVVAEVGLDVVVAEVEQPAISMHEIIRIAARIIKFFLTIFSFY
jgi:hypothetical protein